MWKDYTKTWGGRKSDEFRLAKRAVMKMFKYSAMKRLHGGGTGRKFHIVRVNNNCRLHGVTYSEFICKLKEANINLNRKSLSQLGILDRAAFTNVMDVAIPNWRGVQAKREYVKPPYTVEQVDSYIIPFIESKVPELYTDSCIRFNRKVTDWGLQYTVDMGDPQRWREILPRSPELANFNLPDHWCGNPNATAEPVELENIGWKAGEEPPEYLKFLEKCEKEKKEDEEKKERGEEPWPMRETPLSRDAWFDPEPQTWF